MIDVSVIVPVFNGEKWIDRCMNSISTQSILHNADFRLEIVVYNDGSNDGTCSILCKWAIYFSGRNIPFQVINGFKTRGCGAAKNSAVRKSTGKYLCFQDIDDVMNPERIKLQWKAASLNHNALVGSRVKREPENSTHRFIRWANNLSPKELKVQIYTSNGPTLLMPTWFCHRSVYEKVGQFDESGQGTPEDLLFFYSHIDKGGDLFRVDEELVIYTYHEGATTFSISRNKIWNIQFHRLESYVLSKWSRFTIWNAGKAGRKLIRALNPESLKKVDSFCDVDVNKIGRTVEMYCPIKRVVLAQVPVVHFTQAKPPLLVCVKLDLTKGSFEKNLASLDLIEGHDYVLFS